MLTHLAITNIALISKLGVECASSFTALTGETGAGKSLLMDALGLALGARADLSLIRHGETQAEVSATFRPGTSPALQNLLEEQGLGLEEGHLILRRQLKRDGSGKAWVNGTPTTAGILAQLGALLVDVHAQHGTHALLSAAAQRTLLDGLAGLTPQVRHVAQTYAEWQTAHAAHQTLLAEHTQAQADAERLTAWRNELEELAYQPDEETTLTAQRARLVNFTQLHAALSQADAALNEPAAALTCLRTAARGLQAAAQLDATLQPLATRLEVNLTDLSDAAHDIARATSSLEAEGNLETIDDRLHALKAAARKHQTTIDQLPSVLEHLTTLTGSTAELEEKLSNLSSQSVAAFSRFTAACSSLTAARRRAASTLSPRLEHALRALHLPNATLVISLTELPQSQWNATGADAVELLISANPGSPPQPIAKVASGGELSRVMLALKSVLYQGLAPQTVVFDEIDTGLSGAAAAAVGAAMAAISSHHQVLAITHHPQVAAAANHHFSISKNVENGTTTTTLKPLSGPTRIEELARLLAGANITPQARAAAQSLLAEAHQQPQAA